ncbi:MAG: YraN family protein [Egibacteraceae bacterium]
MARNMALGRIGEQMAVLHLEACGLVVLTRNWRCAGAVRGEIDVVARDGDAIVFCEVKARRGRQTGGPLAAVTPRKQSQLRWLAAAWLAAHRAERAADVRFDVVGVCWPGDGRAEIVHLQGVC